MTASRIAPPRIAPPRIAPPRIAPPRVALLLAAALLGACAGDAPAERAAVADTPAADTAAVVFATAGPLTITHAAAPAPIGDRPGALYFAVHNAGPEADTLVAIATPSAAHAMVHGQQASGGATVMTPLAALAIPAGATVRLAPGGLHVMLEQRRDTLAPGDSLRVTLTFRRAGTVPLAAPVVRYGDLDAYVGGYVGDQMPLGAPRADSVPGVPVARLEGRTAGAAGALALAERLWTAPVLDSLQRAGVHADSIAFALAWQRLRVGERLDLRGALISLLDSTGSALHDAPFAIELTGDALRFDGTALVATTIGEGVVIVRALLPSARGGHAERQLPVTVTP